MADPAPGHQGEALARHGRIEEAEALAREGTILAAATGFLNFHAEAFGDLAEVLRLAGRPREAAEALAESLHLYERKGNLVAAERTRRLLVELEA